MSNQSYTYEKTAQFFPWMGTMNEAGQGAFTRAGEVWQQAATTWQQAATAWQQEMIRFGTDRLQKDSEVGRQTLGCRDWDEIAKLQKNWLTSTAQDYAGVMSRLGDIARDFGKQIEETSRTAVQTSAEGARSAASAARKTAG